MRSGLNERRGWLPAAVLGAALSLGLAGAACTPEQASEGQRTATGPGAEAHRRTGPAGEGGKEPNDASPGSRPADAANGPVAVSGAAVYAQHCATCHMPGGEGVPYMQPALTEAATVQAEEPEVLIRLILNGPGSLGPDEYTHHEYGNNMPAYAGQLSNAEIAAVAGWMRREWGGHAEEAARVSPETVGRYRREQN